MDSRQEFTVQEEDFYKCGDAIISRDQTMFALSCYYCKAIFMELTTFVTHIIWKHQPDLSLNATCVYGAKEDAVFKEEYAMDEVISDPVILENKETLASEGEFIEGVTAEGNPYDNDEHHIIDDGNPRQEIEELESTLLEDLITEDNTEEIQSECENIRNLYGYQSEASIKLEEPAFIDEPNPSQELNADSHELVNKEVDEEEVVEEEEMIPIDDTTTNEENSKSNHLNLYYADRSRSIKEQFKASLEEKYNKYPELWNSNHPQYYNKVLRIKTMKYITKLMQMEYPRKKIALRHIQVQLRKKQNKFAEQLGYKWHNKNKDISKQNTKRNNEEYHEDENCEKENDEDENCEKENDEDENCEKENDEDENCEKENCEEENYKEENCDIKEENVEKNSLKSKSSSSLPDNKPGKSHKSALCGFNPNKLSDIDLALIKLYENEKCLWNVEHSKFTDVKVRMEAYMRIMNEVNRMFFVRRKVKIKELRLRITQLCDWYKAQLRLRYRCKILEKPFQIDSGNEMHFKQFEFLQRIFEPTIQNEEEELKIRDEVEAQYLKLKDAFLTDDDDVDGKTIDAAQFNGTINDEISVNSDVGALEGNAYDDDFSHITKQERLETIRFIEVYRKFPILWNPHLPDSHSFKAKRKAIDDMAKMLTDKYLLPMNTAIVRQKIKNIRNQYKIHFKKIESGIQSNLWLVPQLDEFLKEHIKTSLRRVHTDEPVKKLPPSFDLPFRFDANIPLNIRFIEILRDSPALWQSDDFTFQLSTYLLQVESFHNMIQLLNAEYDMQLDENNMLMLLHDLCEWFKREKVRQQFCNRQAEDDATADQETAIFTPSSVECWERIQFLMNYTILPHNYVCALCQKSSKSITSYLSDRAQHTLQAPFKCFYCDKRFMDITNCRTHECRIHSKIFNYKCNVCDRKFAHATDELVHRRRFHTQERLFVCEMCGKSFVSSYEMKRHRKFHLREPDFTCNMCDKAFVMRRQLIHHKQIDHTIEHDKICKPCGRVFPTMSRLKKHKKLECKATKNGNFRQQTRRRRTKNQHSSYGNVCDDDNIDYDDKSFLRAVEEIIDEIN